jgi:ribosomal protein S6--L-glutamate ligase
MTKTKKNRLVRLFEEYSEKKSILIINFRPKTVSTPGTEDEYAKGFKKADELLVHLADLQGMDAESVTYQDILLEGDEILVKGKSLSEYNYVILGMMAGISLVASIVSDYLDSRGIPHFDYSTLNHKGNKLQDMVNLVKAGLPYVPTFVTADYNSAVKYVNKNWEYPIVAKVMNSSQGDGVEKFDDAASMKDFFSNVKKPDYEDFIMLQRFIPNDGDYRVLIFDNKIIAIAKRVSKDPKKEFRNNMSKGGSGFKADLPHEANQLALDAVKAVGKQMAGVDLIQDKKTGKWYIMEVNSAPQYHYFQEISGIDFPQMLIDKIYAELYGTRKI